jgi:hypothetical protein
VYGDAAQLEGFCAERQTDDADEAAAEAYDTADKDNSAQNLSDFR